MKSFDFTQLGGFPLTQDNLNWMQLSYSEGLSAIANIFGNRNVILAGMNYTGTLEEGTPISSGWACINGQIVEFQATTYPGTPGLKIQELTTTLVFDNGSSFPVKKKTILTWDSGLPAFLFTELLRLNAGWQPLSLTAGYSGTMEYNYNPVSNEVRLRGSVSKSGLAAIDPPYIFYSVGQLPLTLTKKAVGWASVRLHSVATPADTEGKPLWGDRIEVLTDGTVALRWRGLAAGSYTQDFDFTFSLS